MNGDWDNDNHNYPNITMIENGENPRRAHWRVSAILIRVKGISMSNTTSHYPTQVLDANGVVIGEHNTIYQYFHANDAYRTLASKIYNFTTLIEDRTRDFTGREFVFHAIDQFLTENDKGYFIIEGDPGIGKTAIAAELVRSRGYLHHFVIGTQGISGAEEFLQNICAQLIAKYKLQTQLSMVFAGERPSLGNLSAFLGGLLRQVSACLEPNDQCVIVVDALDEAQANHPGENVLLLPSYLPKSIFLIVTRRHKPMHLYLDTHFRIFQISANAKENLDDIRSWLNAKIFLPDFNQVLENAGVTSKEFFDLLVDKSEGNFMYVRHVMHDIANQSNFEPTKQWFKELPQGLVAYYDRHWQLMRATLSPSEWAAIYEPTICVLGVARQSLSAYQIASFAKIDAAIINDLLESVWREFLHREVMQDEPYYRIYHATFQEYLESKVDLTRYHGMIADYLDEAYSQRKKTRASNSLLTSKKSSNMKEHPTAWGKLLGRIFGNE